MLLFVGDRGVPLWGRPSLTAGLSRDTGLSFRALSKALERSLAPGGIVFLLGLPWGVAAGVRKEFLVGVPGRSETGDLPSFALCEGNMLDRKLAMTDFIANEAGYRSSLR